MQQPDILGLLQSALRDNIIDIADLQAKYEMHQKKYYLEQHPYRIWQGANESWYTYLPIKTKSRNIKQIKKSTREKVEAAIIEFWADKEKQETSHTFRDVYFLWRKSHDILVSENTVAKYNTDFTRFFEGQAFAEKPIETITDDDVKVFMRDTIARLELAKEPMRKLFSYICNTTDTARKHGFIIKNPVEFIKSADFASQCRNEYKPLEQQIIPPSEMELLQQQFTKDHEKKPNYIPTYAVEFASLTGMRVAEVSALRWDKITDSHIIIDSSEKANPKKDTFYIGNTKNRRIRLFPVTEDIRKLLEKVKAVQDEYGYESEFVFANENGRIHGKTITACLQTKCRQVGISSRGIYALRKTFNSNIRCNGVSAVVASELLGHSPETNNRYYTFDTTNLQEKNKIVSKVNAQTRMVTQGNTNTCASNF